MIKTLTSLAVALALVGCANTNGFVTKEVVVQYQYVTRTATDQQKRIPPYPATINPTTASQLELAEWIKQSEERQWQLETIITELVRFYEKPFTQSEVNALPVPTVGATPAAAPAPQPASAPAPRTFFRIGR